MQKTPLGPGARLRWHKPKAVSRLPISEAVTPENQRGKLFNPGLECLPATYRVQWLFRKKCIFAFQGCCCSPVSPLKVCSGGTWKCLSGEKTWLKSKAFISDVFGLGIGRHILRAFWFKISWLMQICTKKSMFSARDAVIPPTVDSYTWKSCAVPSSQGECIYSLKWYAFLLVFAKWLA